MAPLKKAGTRLCIAVTRDGVSVYGNKQAFQSLSEWMSWIAASNDADHFECHVTMSLEDDASSFEGKEPRNVWVLTDEEFADSFGRQSEGSPGFELTFMAVEEQDLDELTKFQKTGRLPEGWNQGG